MLTFILLTYLAGVAVLLLFAWDRNYRTFRRIPGEVYYNALTWPVSLAKAVYRAIHRKLYKDDGNQL